MTFQRDWFYSCSLALPVESPQIPDRTNGERITGVGAVLWCLPAITEIIPASPPVSSIRHLPCRNADVLRHGRWGRCTLPQLSTLVPGKQSRQFILRSLTVTGAVIRYNRPGYLSCWASAVLDLWELRGSEGVPVLRQSGVIKHPYSCTKYFTGGVLHISGA